MPQNSIPYAVSRTRVLENRLLTKERLQRLTEAPSASDVLRTLGEYGYGGTQQGDVQTLIQRELGEAYDFIRRVTPNAYATGVLMLKGDCHNAKCILKGKLLQADTRSRLRESGTVDSAKLWETMQKDDVSLLSENMKNASGMILNRMVTGTVEVQWMECVMDAACFADMSDYAQKSGEDAAGQFVRTQADLLNLITLLRIEKTEGGAHLLEQALLPGGTVKFEKYIDALEKVGDELEILELTRYRKSLDSGIDMVKKCGSFGLLEKQCDDVLLKLLKDKRYDRNGVAPLMGYLLAKEREAQAVRLVYMCKNNGVPLAMTQERLRELYA